MYQAQYYFTTMLGTFFCVTDVAYYLLFILLQNPDLEPFPTGYIRQERRRRPAQEVEDEDAPTTFLRGTFEMALFMARLRCHSVVTKVLVLHSTYTNSSAECIYKSGH